MALWCKEKGLDSGAEQLASWQSVVGSLSVSESEEGWKNGADTNSCDLLVGAMMLPCAPSPATVLSRHRPCRGWEAGREAA